MARTGSLDACTSSENPLLTLPCKCPPAPEPQQPQTAFSSTLVGRSPGGVGLRVKLATCAQRDVCGLGRAA